MKRRASVIILVLLFLCFAFVSPQAASNDGPFASGTFQFLVDDGPTRNVEFSARLGTDGTTTGEVTFRDAASATAQTDSATAGPPLSMRAELDCLVIKGNKAMMSGTITESTLERYVGTLLLVVADDDNNESNPSGRDKLTWGFYRPQRRDWSPRDSERPDEADTSITWLAKDAERPEDEGVFANKTEIVGCRTFPISSFTFIDAKHGRGNIQVHQ